MIKLTNQVIYKCSFCGRRMLSRNGAKIHEEKYCHYYESPHKMRIKDIQNKCPHVGKETIYAYIPGECVQEPDYEVCIACGKIV